MGKRSAVRVGQLVLPYEPWEGAQCEATSAAEAPRSSPPDASTGLASRGAEGKRKAFALYHLVTKEHTLWHAWLQVEANDGAPGSDGMSIPDAQRDLRRFLRGLRRELREKRYRPRPARRVVIPKAGGGERELGIPCVRDRIVQTAVARVLEPIFEAKFNDGSHGFRPGRGCQTALSLVDRAVRYGY